MNISLSNLDLSANTTPNSHLKMKLQKGMYNSHINLNKDFESISLGVRQKTCLLDLLKNSIIVWVFCT